MALSPAQQFDAILNKLGIPDANHTKRDWLVREFQDKDGLLHMVPTGALAQRSLYDWGVLDAQGQPTFTDAEWKRMLRWCSAELKEEARQEARQEGEQGRFCSVL